MRPRSLLPGVAAFRIYSYRDDGSLILCEVSHCPWKKGLFCDHGRQERQHLREPRFRRQALEGRRRAAQQHGRSRVQARRPRADLSQVHLGYLRRATHPAGSRTRQGADPEDPDEYRAANTFWVPKEARWAFLLASAKQPTIGKTVDDAMLAVERDNPSLKGVLPEDYAHPRLDKQRLGQLIDMIGNIGLGDKANRSKDILGRVLRVLPLPVRQRGGQEGRPVLHAALRRATAGRDADAVQGPRLRPVLRLRRHVRAVGEVRGGPRRPGGRHLRLRAGIEPDHLEAREDEPGDPRHRRQPGAGARRQLPPRPAPRPEGRLRPRQPALQRQRLAAASCCATTSAGSSARRRPATPTTPGCSTSSITWRRPARRASCWPTARCPPTSAARGKSARRSSRPTWWTAWSRCRGSCSTRPRFRSACGSWPATNPGQTAGPRAPPRRDPLHRRPQARHADRPRALRADRRGHRPDRRHLPRVARERRGGSPRPTSMCPASARPRRWTRCGGMATC